MSEENDEILFARLFAEHESTLYGFVYSMLPHRSDADDVMQEAMTKIWGNIDSYDRNRPFLPWARKFAYNQVLMHRRKQRTHGKYFSDVVIESLAEEQPDDATWDQAQLAALKTCMNELSMDEQELLSHRYQGNHTLQQFAASLDRTANALYKQLQKLRRRLFVCINQELRSTGTS